GPSQEKPGPAAQLIDCDGCPEMILISAGDFIMGRDDGEPKRYDGPPHPVSIASDYYLGKTEVTYAQFAEFVAESGHAPVQGCNIFLDGKWGKAAWANWQNPGLPQPPKENDPVVCVSWDDATAYVNWLAQKTGQPYRLPSEAEWEFAARAGTQSEYPWGEDKDAGCAIANMFDVAGDAVYPQYPWPNATCTDGFADTAPVGSLSPNPLGLYDIMGSVWEWTQDCYVLPYPADAPSDGTALEVEGTCERRTVRGGSWQTRPDRFAVAWRGRDAPDDGFGTFGLRVARSVKGE
ncbi:MAG: formylglycine-generating enzyme family protein, partial [Pseudomonadota bacterium]